MSAHDTDHLAGYALTAGDRVEVEVRTGTPRRQTVTGTVTGATAYVLIIGRDDSEAISRLPWRSILTIDAPTAVRHPATA